MNQIVNLNTAATLTMSSHEIADLTGKRHDHVMRDIRAMLDGLGTTGPSFGGSYIDPTGRKLPCFNLPKRETLILISGYSVELRARIIDRWMELEAAILHAPVETRETASVLARYIADMQEKIVAPLVKVVADLVAAHAGVPLLESASVYVPTPEDLKPVMKSSTIAKLPGVPLSMSSPEIGKKMSAYSVEHGLPVIWRDKSKPNSVNKYCRAAVIGCFDLPA